jgi:pyruvate, orthophosphate dikinase
MVAAEGILTSRGGKTSHAAVVARGMGKTAVCGTESILVDEKLLQLSVGDLIIREGEIISIDGTTGCVYLGELPVTPSPVTTYLEGNLSATSDDSNTGCKSC